MKLLHHSLSLEHDTGHHPESASRLDSFSTLPELAVEGDEKILKLVHTEQYIEKVKKCSRLGVSLDPDTILSEKSFDAAVMAAQISLFAAETGDFALIRPPGHHAYANHGSGFCLFNNIAIATTSLLNQGKRVAIVDIDGHFGDGTSSIFYETDQVLYISIHQSPAFPYKGVVSEIGKGIGSGFNINISLPPYSGDDIAEDALTLIIPILRQFNPDYLGISAGFDAHIMDPLLQLRWSANIFHRIGKSMSKNFTNVFACLEGGYNTDELPLCIESFLGGVNQSKKKTHERHTDSEILVWNEYEMRLSNLINHLKPYWKI